MNITINAEKKIEKDFFVDAREKFADETLMGLSPEFSSEIDQGNGLDLSV